MKAFIWKIAATGLLLFAGQALISNVFAEKLDASDAPAIEGPPFVEQGHDDLSSPFSRQQVLMLNAIVALSLHTIRQFDSELADVHQAIAAYADAPEEASIDVRLAADAAMGRIVSLAESASKASKTMHQAEAELIASGEPYNEVILAAMVSFVQDVDDEITRERHQLSNSLPAHGSSTAVDVPE